MAAQADATETDLTGILLCAGNPLLDISAEVPMTVLEKVGWKYGSEQAPPLIGEFWIPPRLPAGKRRALTQITRFSIHR